MTDTHNPNYSEELAPRSFNGNDERDATLESSVPLDDHLCIPEYSPVVKPSGGSLPTPGSDSDSGRAHGVSGKPPSPLSRVMNTIVPRGGLFAGAFNMASVTFGAGVMSIPQAFKTAGVLMAFFYLAIITTLTIFSIVLLVQVADKTGLRSFESLARHLFGRGGDFFVAIIMWLLCFGGAAGYVVATGDIFRALLDHDGTPHFLTTAWGRRCLVTGVWLLFMLPVALPKRVNSLRYVSAVGVSFIVFFVFCVVGYSVADGMPYLHEVLLFQGGNSAAFAVSIFIFSYLCQVNCLKIYYEMPRPNVFGMAVQATLSCGMCGTLYFLIGFFGYAAIGNQLSGNILNYYNIYQVPLFFVCYVGIIVKLVASFSQNMLACRTALFQIMRWDVDTMPYWKHTVFAGSFAAGALILGLLVPDIDIIFGLAGAFCGGFIGFIFPALFMMYSGKWGYQTVGWVSYVATYFLLLSGVVGVCFGSISTVYQTVQKYS